MQAFVYLRLGHVALASRAASVTAPDPRRPAARLLWLSGRYDNVEYAIDTMNGEVKTIAVGREPHGLAVWPQPGRYSLGHTGNMR